jgi:serine/threonine-protein kinase HipA
MTSSPSHDEAYVWIWLPGATEPAVAGRVSCDGDRLVFNYGQSFLSRPDAIPIFEPELPLRRGVIAPKAGLTVAGCLRMALRTPGPSRSGLFSPWSASRGTHTSG